MFVTNFAQKFAQKVMGLQEQIKQDGIKLGMCDKFVEMWGEPDIKTLCEFYFRGQDFCIEKNFPSIELFEQHSKEIAPYGIYSKNGNAVSQPFVAALGDAEVTVDVHSSTDLTVRHKAVVVLRLYGKSLCYVSAHDKCKVIVAHKDPQSRLCMSYWGGEILNKEMFDKINYK